MHAALDINRKASTRCHMTQANKVALQVRTRFSAEVLNISGNSPARYSRSGADSLVIDYRHGLNVMSFCTAVVRRALLINPEGHISGRDAAVGRDAELVQEAQDLSDDEANKLGLRADK